MKITTTNLGFRFQYWFISNQSKCESTYFSRLYYKRYHITHQWLYYTI